MASGAIKRLPEATVFDVYLPLAERIATLTRESHGTPLVVALSGTPGTGKSTLAAHLGALLDGGWGLRVAGFSMDDLYYPHEERQELGRRVHPLFARRGVPGTHDLALGFRTLDSLGAATVDTDTPLPRFSKLTDDPWPLGDWPRFSGRPDVITIDSWFWRPARASSGELSLPMNELEAEEDADGTWRRTVERFLEQGYPELFSRAHFWVHLAAPSWSATVRWRIDQEHDMLASLPPDQRPRGDTTGHLPYFLQLFQRLGIRRHSEPPDVTLQLGEDHSIAGALAR